MTNKNFFFSIVVPTLNEEKNLPKLLESVEKQSLSVPHQIVISDNGSTDKTVTVAQKSGVQVVTGSRRGYIGEARAFGCREALKLIKNDPKGEEIIINTDADCILGRDYFAQIASAYQHPEINASMGPVIFRDKRRQLTFRKVYHPIALTIVATNLQAWWLLKYLHKTATLFGANTVIRRKTYEKYGGFSAEARVVEDLDLTLTLLKNGQTISYLSDQTVITSARKFINTEGKIDPGKILHYFFDHKMGIYHGQTLLTDKYRGGLGISEKTLISSLEEKIRGRK